MNRSNTTPFYHPNYTNTLHERSPFLSSLLLLNDNINGHYIPQNFSRGGGGFFFQHVSFSFSLSLCVCVCVCVSFVIIRIDSPISPFFFSPLKRAQVWAGWAGMAPSFLFLFLFLFLFNDWRLACFFFCFVFGKALGQRGNPPARHRFLAENTKYSIHLFYPSISS
ncbi:hypothetical protein DM02DRAFT_214057 [Periconia macrospinosa]|uniref:Uncharacterized protein n=1 Tax=Periconia macrospinosa TaxID=97972 RepID=A0A2V1E2P9_9PLEO|nr:hypothetical protein DM02DRAFT_214057 [Periconia macrospinosa]